MTRSRRRVRAIIVKELREYRRNRSVVGGMSIIPLLLLVQPLVTVFAVAAPAAGDLSHRHELLYLLAIPAVVPATLAAYAIVGERQQGTLEPVLSTPITGDELLLGKALAVLCPSVVIAYAVYGVFLVLVGLFAHPGIASALIRAPDIVAQLVFTPLIAGCSIWIAIMISTRVGEVRSAQQLGALASLPSIAVSTLISINVIHATLELALILGAALLVGNRLGWRIVSAAFNRERLVTGTRP
jgi:ABC-type transport system involved in multi-copper enzyme maturation permease subunit